MIETTDAPEIGAALLATVRDRLTGHEIHACEWAQEDDFEWEDGEFFNDAMDVEFPELDDDFDSTRFAEIKGNLHTLSSLAIQFSREIGNWIDNRNREASRRAVQTHNRLQLSKA